MIKRNPFEMVEILDVIEEDDYEAERAMETAPVEDEDDFGFDDPEELVFDDF